MKEPNEIDKCEKSTKRTFWESMEKLSNYKYYLIFKLINELPPGQHQLCQRHCNDWIITNDCYMDLSLMGLKFILETYED